MSNKALNHVWETSKAKGNALLVLIAIADMANDDGECWPGQTKLSKKCRISDRYLRTMIAKLTSLGELEITTHGGADTGTGKTNLYKVLGIEPQESEGRNGESALAPVEGGTGNPPLENEGRNGESALHRQGRNSSSGEGRNSSSDDPLYDPLYKNDPSLKDSDPDGSGGEASPDFYDQPLSVPNWDDLSKRDQSASMFMAFCEAFGFDHKQLTSDMRGKINAAEKQVREAGARPCDIALVHRYCTSKLDHFGPNAISTHLDLWRADVAKKAPKPLEPGERGDPHFNPIFANMSIQEQFEYNRRAVIEGVEKAVNHGATS